MSNTYPAILVHGIYGRQDILALAKGGLLTATALQQRATEALDYFCR